MVSSTQATLRGRLILGMASVFTLGSCANNATEAPGWTAVEVVVHQPESGEPFFGELTQITFGGQNAEAYFSASGTHLIFQRTESDTTCDQQYVFRLDDPAMRRVSNGLGRTTCGFFYAGDRRVLYSSTFGAGEACPPPPDRSRGYVWPLADFEIYTSLPGGSDLQQLTHSPGYDAEATLSADGSSIVFTSTRDGDVDVYSMDVDGSNVRRLTSTVGYDGGPFYSPDGSKIVYRSWHPETDDGVREFQGLLAENLVRPSRMELWIMNSDGSDQHQVTALGGANFAPFFHPDGQRIIFSSNHEDPAGREFDLFMVNVDGSGLVKVTTSIDFDGFPMFSRDGTKLVFASNRHGRVERETNIFVAEWIERN